MRISYWSSDVCSSDLRLALCQTQAKQLFRQEGLAPEARPDLVQQAAGEQHRQAEAHRGLATGQWQPLGQPLRAVEGQRGSASGIEIGRATGRESVCPYV